MYKKIPQISYCASVVDWNKIEATSPRVHTVAIWTFTFHEKSGCVWGDLEGQFQTSLPVKIINFLQELSNPVLFAHCHSLLFQWVEIFHKYDLSAGLKLAFQITFTQPDFLWNINFQIATVCRSQIFVRFIPFFGFNT